MFLTFSHILLLIVMSVQGKEYRQPRVATHRLLSFVSELCVNTLRRTKSLGRTRSLITLMRQTTMNDWILNYTKLTK